MGGKEEGFEGTLLVIGVSNTECVEGTLKQPRSSEWSFKRGYETDFGSGTLKLEGLESDVEALLHYSEDGSVEVHKWIK